MITGDDDRLVVTRFTDRPDLVVDGPVNLPDLLVVAGVVVKDGVGLLELEEAELGVIPVGEIPERLPRIRASSR